MFKITSICQGGGYRYCRTKPLHPNRNSNGLYPLHRVLLENKLGRLLTKKEIAHHIDGNKTNDIPENIGLRTFSNHSIEHAKIRKVDNVKLVCPICGKNFELTQYFYRIRLRRSLSKVLGCSRRCGIKIWYLFKNKLKVNGSNPFPTTINNKEKL